MSRIILAVLGCVLATVMPVTAHSLPMETLLKRYDEIETEDIVWGNESEDMRRVGEIDPPFFTSHPDLVEIFELGKYTTRAWQRSEPFTRAWRDSLPERVRVRRLPQRAGKTYKHAYRDLWPVHQRMYFAGSMLGLETEVHEILLSMNRQGLKSKLGSEGIPELAGRLDVSLDEFRSWYHHPRVNGLVRLASLIEFAKTKVLLRLGVDGKSSALYPAFVINGRFVVDTSAVKSPREGIPNREPPHPTRDRSWACPRRSDQQ